MYNSKVYIVFDAFMSTEYNKIKESTQGAECSGVTDMQLQHNLMKVKREVRELQGTKVTKYD